MFQMAAKPMRAAPPACNGAAVADGYAATADPVKPGVSGNYLSTASTPTESCTWTKQQTFTGNLAESGAAGHGAEVK